MVWCEVFGQQCCLWRWSFARRLDLAASERFTVRALLRVFVSMAADAFAMKQYQKGVFLLRCLLRSIAFFLDSSTTWACCRRVVSRLHIVSVKFSCLLLYEVRRLLVPFPFPTRLLTCPFPPSHLLVRTTHTIHSFPQSDGGSDGKRRSASRSPHAKAKSSPGAGKAAAEA